MASKTMRATATATTGGSIRLKRACVGTSASPRYRLFATVSPHRPCSTKGNIAYCCIDARTMAVQKRTLSQDMTLCGHTVRRSTDCMYRRVARSHSNLSRSERVSVRASAKMTSEEATESLELTQMEAEERMTKAVEVVTSNYSTVRTGRASTALLDRIKVVR